MYGRSVAVVLSKSTVTTNITPTNQSECQCGFSTISPTEQADSFVGLSIQAGTLTIKLTLLFCTKSPTLLLISPHFRSEALWSLTSTTSHSLISQRHDRRQLYLQETKFEAENLYNLQVFSLVSLCPLQLQTFSHADDWCEQAFVSVWFYILLHMIVS